VVKTITLSGQSGRLNLKDSVVEFGNWRIYENIVGQNEPGLNDWNGSFEIQKSDIGAYFNSLFGGETITADFYGNENCNGKIISKEGYISSDDPIVKSRFIGTGELKKMP
jgi:hypothetical protein